MKTIVWKELREHGFWVPLALAATSLITLYAMYGQDLLFNRLDLMAMSVFAAAIIASLLGAFQSWSNYRLESRALLLHRSITAKAAFAAKFIAGLLMHSLATLPPLLAAAVWIAMDDRHTLVAYWDEMLPVMGYTLLAFLCWPASFLVVQRHARWIGSRLLPLPCAIWILAFSVMSTESVDSQLCWVGLGLAVFAAGTFSFAAYNTFVSLGRVNGSPRVALGMLHGLSLLVAAFATAIAIQQYHYEHSYLAGTSTTHSIRLDQDGEPILAFAEFSGNQIRRSKAAKMSTEGSVLDQLKAVDDWEVSLSRLPTWYLANSEPRLASMNASQKLFQVLGTLARRIATPPRTADADSLQRNLVGQILNPKLAVWIYVLDRRSGKILVYSEDNELTHELSPEKATGAIRFRELADNSAWNANFYYSHYSAAQVVYAPQGETYLVVAFEDAAYVLENDGMTVSRFFDMPNGTPLIASSKCNQFGAGVVDQGLRFGDRLVMIQPRGDRERKTTSETASVQGVRYFQTTVNLPTQLVDAPLLQIARLPGSRDELVALATKGGDNYLWVRLNVAGEVLEERTYHQPTPSTGPAYQQAPQVLVAALFPLIGFGLLVMISLSVGQGLEQFEWDYWLANPSASIAFCAFLVLQIVVALSLTYWACRHYRFSKTVTRRWLFASLLGGPFVGLGLMSVTTPVAIQWCATCRKRCRADVGECENCQQALDQPSRRGIEIFDNERVNPVATVAI